MNMGVDLMLSNSFISNFKIILKRIFLFIMLALCFIFIFYRYTKITQYPRDDFFDFYRNIDKGTVDVLCVGSSHVYNGINPVQMWDDYGIAAYDLACGSQSVWFSYYYIKEALKTQHPEIVILDVYTLRNADDYFDTKIQANLVNLPLSYNKWEALEVAGADNKVELFFQFPIFHSRYDSLSRYDFDLDLNGNLKFLGYRYTEDIVPYEEEKIMDVRGVEECEPISKKAEEYLRKSIELCQESDIDIILTNTPWPDITEIEQKKYNYVQTIADEYSVTFLNGCLFNEEIGMDYMTDSMGDGGHLNHAGVTKYTSWLTDKIQEKHTLPDRRTDVRWAEWQRQSDKLKAVMRRNEIGQINELEEYLNCIENENSIYYVVALNENDHGDGVSGNEILDTLEDRGIDTEQNGVFVMNGNSPLFKSDGCGGYNWWYYFGDSVLNVYERDGSPVICLDKWECGLVSQGINIIVYDELLDEMIGRIGFDAERGYEVVR